MRTRPGEVAVELAPPTDRTPVDAAVVDRGLGPGGYAQGRDDGQQPPMAVVLFQGLPPTVPVTV